MPDRRLSSLRLKRSNRRGTNSGATPGPRSSTTRRKRSPCSTADLDGWRAVAERVQDQVRGDPLEGDRVGDERVRRARPAGARRRRGRRRSSAGAPRAARAGRSARAGRPRCPTRSARGRAAGRRGRAGGRSGRRAGRAARAPARPRRSSTRACSVAAIPWTTAIGARSSCEAIETKSSLSRSAGRRRAPCRRRRPRPRLSAAQHGEVGLRPAAGLPSPGPPARARPADAIRRA